MLWASGVVNGRYDQIWYCWRRLACAEFFLRIARALPERFQVTGIVVRNPEKAQLVAAQWQVPVFSTYEELLRHADLSFVVVSVPWQVAPSLLQAFTELNIPVLTETPPAPDLDGLRALQPLIARGAKIQVSEQYQFQPLLAARLAIASSGKLGTISSAHVSVAHGYHGISVLRKFLSAGFASPTITAQQFTAPLKDGLKGHGYHVFEQAQPVRQVIALLNFGDRLGVFDFCDEQYYSTIRSQQLMVRGELGEIHDLTVSYLQDGQIPVNYTLTHQDAGHGGNLEGYYHKGILASGEWVFRNPYMPASLMDDEIAIAICLEKMGQYAEGGPDFYNLAEAAQDHYLNLLISQAVASGQPVEATTQVWAE
jgi:predicted dehydrogenase